MITSKIKITRFHYLGQIPADFTGATIIDNPGSNFNGRFARMVKGIIHCTYAPAVTYPNGIEYWYINGIPKIQEQVRLLYRIKKEI